MPIRPFSLLSLAGALLALAACDRDEPGKPPARALDPAIVAALADPIMIDPDLVSQNRGNAAIAIDTFDAVPLDDTSPEAVEAAKAEAAQLAGGMIRTAPEPAASGGAILPAVTAVQLAAGLPSACAGELRQGYAWAASFPSAVPIYPRAHVQDAAGSDAAGCAVRSAIFLTPVDPTAILDFYHTRTGDSGYRAQRSRRGEADVLSGSKGGSVFLVRIRQRQDGLSEVELAVRG